MHMRTVRPAIAADPRHFGRRFPTLFAETETDDPAILDDLKLFATTFAVGFLFVTVLIF